MVFYQCVICGWTQIRYREVEAHIKQNHPTKSLIKETENIGVW